MSSYLVTGGAGFVGSHLVDNLVESGHKVIVLDDLSSGKEININKSADFIKGSITDNSILESALKEVDVCYHLAAIPSVQASIKNWSECHKVNLGGTINIFELAAAKNIPVIYASSAAIYGSPSKTPILEDSEIAPESPYGFDKYSNEVHAKLFAKLKGLKSVGMRFFNVYGPRQDPASPYSGVISTFLEKMMNNEKIKLFDDGDQTRDFIHVTDVARALIKADNSSALSAGETFNVCTGKGISINHLIEVLGEITKKKVEINHLPARVGDVYHSIGDMTKAEKLIQFKAMVDIKEGLSDLYHYNTKNP